MPVMTTPKAYTIEEVAEILKVHPMTVRRALSDGRLHGFRIGTAWRISQKQLDEFMEGQGREEARS